MQKRALLLIFILFISVLTGNITLLGQNLSNPGYHEVTIEMDDGVKLSTDVFIPKSHKKCPAVLVRTPYGKFAEKWMGRAFGLFKIAVVIQDVRGKYKSDGEYYPFKNEREDGLRTLQWIRQQPWSNGIVSGWGASYVGFTQWAISDSLDFLVPLLTGANLYDLFYPDGVFSLQSAFNWGLLNASRDQNKISADKISNSMRILPLSAADDSTICEIPFLTDWLSHETEDQYWKNMSYRGMTKAPVLCVAGWYDVFLKAQLADFNHLKANGNPENRMVIGPWCHGSQGLKNEYGGIRKTSDPKALFAYTVKFLKGRRKTLSSPLKDARYNLFIMERNEYVGSESWPPAGTCNTPYYLGPDKSLTAKNPEFQGSVSYDYDPSDPLPSHGGTALGDHVGPALQNDNLDRNDQLVFETPAMEKPMILLGDISATLWFSSDVPCTGLVVCLQDVFPDGRIVNIQEGAAKIYLSGTIPQKKEVSVWATGYQINPGHKLKVMITSSWFPRFNRSLNGCEPLFSAATLTKAHQTVFFGAAYPSCISLPVYAFPKK
ncbi:MAG: hypothetical protein A2X22_04930 [Bacteroidetes bacterium GWF2_49_14]|nr:MAG: hypothetical protein A2X22_04930 [Bacteroidetes bacterium GWF2_49_14]